MSIQKQEYELSVWHETLGENGQKIETKEYVIGGHDMTYLGRATNIIFTKKLNGTHELTFDMPDRFFDSARGEYIENEYIKDLFNEKKIKLHFLNSWYEFYIKSVKDSKKFKSYIKSFTCSDAFIDELSRNGYGITFDTELYNNVEEIGTFTRIILEDSIWEYEPRYNWGDFTEYTEEKLFKIPVGENGLFSEVHGYKLNFKIDNPKEDEYIKNVYTKQTRPIEISDDLAAAQDGKGGYFWDSYDNTMPLLSGEAQVVPNDGYIYIPYSQLEFCYKTTSLENNAVLTATEEVCYYKDENGNKSYAIAPNTVDPTALIQFIAFPKNAKIEIDEAGLIVNKDYTYVMTVADWNKYIKSSCYYQFLPIDNKGKKTFVTDKEELTPDELAVGNKAGYYEGYLDKIKDLEVLYGKKISITVRTEVNITEEIDQYVTVYRNKSEEYENIDEVNLYVNPDEKWQGDNANYRVCSKKDTRQIIPQLARNLVQNGVNIKRTDGWEVQAIYDGEDAVSWSTVELKVEQDGTLENDTDPTKATIKETYLKMSPSVKKIEETYEIPEDERYNTIINFGIIAQEYEITSDKIYCLGIKADNGDNSVQPKIKIKIGEGGVLTQGEYTIDENAIVLSLEDDQIFGSSNEGYVFIKFKHNIKNPYIAIVNNNTEDLHLYGLWFFEAYTKGTDQFAGTDESAPEYRYSGRELFDSVLYLDKELYKISSPISKEDIHNKILFEEDVMPGDTYEYQKYFIQQVVAYPSNYKTGERISGEYVVADTFAAKELLNDDVESINFENTNLSKNQLPYSAAQFTNDDLEISTKYIDLNKCPYYKKNAKANECDCSYNEGEHVCLYQKYGYCPYLFTSEKHCRKIRTLSGEKSNRFNLTQELSKVFEIYPIYHTEHDDNGKVLKETVTKEDGTTYEKMKKKVFYITEKGVENKLGFRYEKNLSDISRTIKSNEIVTKLYVEDVDSELSKTGLCSIKTAEDNPSKDSFIIDFSYYTTKGILDKDSVDADLYGKDENDIGYLKKLGYLNTQYDQLSNAIINLSNESYTELESNVQVNVEGIASAQKQLFKIKKQMDKYKNTNSTQNKTYDNYVTKYNEQLGILNNLIFETFFDPITLQYHQINFPFEKSCQIADENRTQVSSFFDEATLKEEEEEKTFEGMPLEKMKESHWFKQHTYSFGMLGQFNREYLQLQEWRKKQSMYLKEINKISLQFFQKYEPYLKEGTWSDSNYLTDNAYYFGAKEVSAEGAIPKVEYDISVVDLFALPGFEDYYFDIADVTYVEDIGMFGVNKTTGLPNRLKVLISEISYNLEEPPKNSIKVQNFTTQFEDLFQQVTASVQSLTFNENIYKRSSNFTSNQNITEDSLQGTLDQNGVTLLNTQENNIELDKQGQSGSDINNHSNKYKLNGQGMLFSNDGGQTWDIGVGPSGINADYITVGTLDAGKIRIVDNDYLYFLWDKDGIVAFRDPKDVQDTKDMFSDFAVFNRYGLSLVENGQIRLRSGYEFTGTAGEYKSESVMGDNLGFYLYDNSGNVIFSTHPNKEDSARLSLKGEMFISDNLDGSQTTFYTYSDLQYKLVERSISQVEELNGDFDSYTSDNSEEEGEENSNLKSYCKSLLSKDRIPETQRAFSKDSETYTFYFSAAGPTSFLHDSKYYSSPGLRVSGGDIDTIILVKIDDTIYKTTGEKENCYISVNKDDEDDSYSTKTKIEQNNEEIKYYDSTSNGEEQKTLEANSYYAFSLGNIYLYSNRESSTEKIESQKNSVGILIHNKAVGKDLSEGEFYRRVFSCLRVPNSSPGDGFVNLFTILSDGSLYIGGRMFPLDGDTNSIDSASDYMKFNSDYEENSVRIDASGTLYIGTQNLIEYFRTEIQSIRDAIDEIGLIRHSHSFSIENANLTVSSSYQVNVKNGSGNEEFKDLSEVLQGITISYSGETDETGV